MNRREFLAMSGATFLYSILAAEGIIALTFNGRIEKSASFENHLLLNNYLKAVVSKNYLQEFSRMEIDIKGRDELVLRRWGDNYYHMSVPDLTPHKVFDTAGINIDWTVFKFPSINTAIDDGVFPYAKERLGENDEFSMKVYSPDLPFHFDNPYTQYEYQNLGAEFINQAIAQKLPRMNINNIPPENIHFSQSILFTMNSTGTVRTDTLALTISFMEAESNGKTGDFYLPAPNQLTSLTPVNMIIIDDNPGIAIPIEAPPEWEDAFFEDSKGANHKVLVDLLSAL